MAQLYARVFLKILESSIAEDFTLRHVFEDFLKVAEDGIVDATRQALARRFNIPLDTLNKCITKLEQPDKSSRDEDFEGRRIERLDEHRDWGWRILNWSKWEQLRTRADVAIRQARHRKKKQEVVGESSSRDQEPDGGRPTENEVDEKTYLPGCRVLLHYLNEKSGKKFRELAANLDPINGRLKEDGVTVEGCKQMIDRQVDRWKETEQSDYLRPETLFRRSKFDGYYAAREMPVNRKEQHGNQASQHPIAGRTSPVKPVAGSAKVGKF